MQLTQANPLVFSGPTVSYRTTRIPPTGRKRLLLATAVCLVIYGAILAISSSVLHWFAIPVFACGVICCRDGFSAFGRGHRSPFEPLPILGFFGLYFFFVAPLLHVARDYWFTSSVSAPLERPEDWRPWLGWMGVVNLSGLLLYKACHQGFAFLFARRRGNAVREVNPPAMRFWGIIFLSIAALLQVYIYAAFGGIGSFLDAYDATVQGKANAFQGMGWIMCLGESFPILLLIVWSSVFPIRRPVSLFRLSAILVALFGLILVFGGLRGSRGNTVFAALFALAIVHLRLRRVTWRLLAVCGLALLIFMYAYGFYKVNRYTFLEAVFSPDYRSSIEAKTGRSLDAVLLGDLDRADIQAYLLMRMTQDDSVAYAYGQTYFDSAVSFVPYSILPYRPPGKLKFGTEVQFGNGSYSPGRLAATKIYGAVGEFMLNFGPWAGSLAFVFVAAITGYLQSLIRSLTPRDAMHYLVPILSIGCVVAISSDFDNILYLLLRQALMPALLIWLGSSSRRVGARTAPPR